MRLGRCLDIESYFSEGMGSGLEGGVSEVEPECLEVIYYMGGGVGLRSMNALGSLIDGIVAGVR